MSALRQAQGPLLLQQKNLLLKVAGLFFHLKLSSKDSNLDRQNQNLQCCHYTTRHHSFPNAAAKVQLISLRASVFFIFLKKSDFEYYSNRFYRFSTQDKPKNSIFAVWQMPKLTR